MKMTMNSFKILLDPVHTGPDPYGHHINLKSLKTSMTHEFVIILQNLIKAYHRKSGKSKYDRKLTELQGVAKKKRAPPPTKTNVNQVNACNVVYYVKK